MAAVLASGHLTFIVGCQEDVHGPPVAENSPALNDPTSSAPQAAVLANTWQGRRSGLPPARIELVAGTINGVIYVAGGDTGMDPVREVMHVDAYNVSSNTWSPRQQLPGARRSMNGASVINGKLYVTGGVRPLPDGGSTITRTTFVYNPKTNLWARKADMPMAGANGAQGVIGGQLYVYLGTVPGTGALLRYNPTTNRWVKLAPPPVGHEHGMGGVINGRFYLAGGCCDRTNLPATRNLSVYNPNTNTWTARAPMATYRSNAASGVINGKLYVAGGTDDVGAETNSVEVYDPATNKWTFRASMPSFRAGTAGAVAGGKLFVIGGLGGDAMRNEAYTP